jgi:hypothetical protein
LIEADPDIGYKDDAWMLDLFRQQSLKIIHHSAIILDLASDEMVGCHK